MAVSSQPKTPHPQNFRTGEVYLLCVAAFFLGCALGYFATGKKSPSPTAGVRPANNSSSAAATYAPVHSFLTVEQMKQMADVQASTMIEKSKGEPKNASLLVQIASIYQGAHQFQTAADYYEKALNIDGKKVNARSQMASCLFYAGHVDDALHQLQLALKRDPKNINALFNLGMIKYKGKNDSAGAITAWRELLKSHPDLDRKPMVEKMIAEAQSAGSASK